MQSSSNQYLYKLDHLRAFAIFQVFCWHLLYQDGHVFYDSTPFPFGLLAQGHTGVALFMCISGYIFTYLAHGMKVNIPKFWANRFLRLAPLMIFWYILGTAVTDQRNPFSYNYIQYLYNNYNGITDHNGYWSIYAEMRYYLVFPLLLFLIRRFGPKILFILLFLPMLYRSQVCGTPDCPMQLISYWQAPGRADQFLCGTAAFYIEQYLRTHTVHFTRWLRLIGLSGFLAIAIFYHWFNAKGGWIGYHEIIISRDVLWLYIPMIEGICYSAVIIGYLHCNIPNLLSRILTPIGKYSFSIYLGHPHFVHSIFNMLSLYIGMPSDSILIRLLVLTFVGFPVMVAIAAISYRFIELPFLKLRLKYLTPL